MTFTFLAYRLVDFIIFFGIILTILLISSLLSILLFLLIFKFFWSSLVIFFYLIKYSCIGLFVNIYNPFDLIFRLAFTSLFIRILLELPAMVTFFGCWLLVVGCWLLVVGCWLLV